MAFDSSTPRLSDADRKIADEARAKTLEGIRANQGFVVPAHLKGTLFSPRDLLGPALKASGDELRAYLDASRARLSRTPQAAPSPDTLQSGKEAA